MSKEPSGDLPRRLVRLGTRRHAQREGRLDGRAGVPGTAWGTERAPSDEGFDALGAMAQAQIGAVFYQRIEPLYIEWQTAYRDLLYARRELANVSAETATARREFAELRRGLEDSER